MIKDNQKIFNRLHLVMDACITAVSYALAYYIRFYISKPGPEVGDLPGRSYFMMLLAIIPLYMVLYYKCNIYTPKRTSRRRHEIGKIIQANAIGITVFILFLYLVLKEINISRGMILLFPYRPA